MGTVSETMAPLEGLPIQPGIAGGGVAGGGVGVLVGVLVGLLVGVLVGPPGVLVGVIGVAVGVFVGVGVFVAMGVLVGVGEVGSAKPSMPTLRLCRMGLRPSLARPKVTVTFRYWPSATDNGPPLVAVSAGP